MTHYATPQTLFKLIYYSTATRATRAFLLFTALVSFSCTSTATLFILAQTTTYDDELDFLKMANKEALP